LTFWPIAVLILHGGFSAKQFTLTQNSRALRLFNLVSLFCFWLGFYTFLMAPVCKYPNVHSSAAAIFVFSIFFHFVIMARLFFLAGYKGRGIFTLASALLMLLEGMAFVLTGLHYETTMDPNIVYLPWFFEVLAISTALGITPCLMIKDWWDGMPFLRPGEVACAPADDGDHDATQGAPAVTPVAIELEGLTPA